jgi:hypothetical protein
LVVELCAVLPVVRGVELLVEALLDGGALA